MRDLGWLPLVLAALACGSVSSHEPDAPGAADGPGAADAPATIDSGPADAPVVCDDFSGAGEGWTVVGGGWTVVGGAYQGTGGDPLITCTNYYASVRRDLVSADVAVDLSMTSHFQVDKFLVLREDASGNRIEVDFRSDRGSFPPDIMVQECFGGTYTVHTAEFEVADPGDVVDTALPVSVELVGNHLTVTTNGTVRLDRDFSFNVTSGSVGLAVLNTGVSTFDDVKIRSLDAR